MAGGSLMVEGESFRELKRQERAYSGAHLLGQWSRTSDEARDELRAYFNRFSLDHWMVLNNGARPSWTPSTWAIAITSPPSAGTTSSPAWATATLPATPR